MIELKQVVAGYGKKEVLHNLSLAFEAGKLTVVIGKNGCGKSTLLKTLIGMVPLAGGEISLDGVSVTAMSAGELAKRIAYLSQGRQAPEISVGRLVLHGRFPYLSYPRKYGERDREIAARAMRQMGIMELAEMQMSELSGGMRQKAYIAMALAQQAPVIVMDEPTTYLDIGQQLNFAQTVRALSQDGKTVILVLHDLLLALKIADSLVVMQEGNVLAKGTPEEIIERKVIDTVFGVRLGRLETERGIQYYYDIG